MSAFADPDKDLAQARRNERVLDLKSQGVSDSDIALRVGVDVRTVFRIVKAEADRIRANVQGRCEEAFMLHDRRLEVLYAAAQKKLDGLAPTASPQDFCNCIRAAIMVLERQARLLGLDREKAKGGADKNDWLDAASEDELRDHAARCGLVVPKRLDEPEATAPAHAAI